MNDPVADSGRSGRASHRRRPGPGRRTAAVALARALCITAALVAAYFLLPVNGGDTGSWTLLASGLLALVLFFSGAVRVIVRSPWPLLRAVETLTVTLSLYLVLFASSYYLLERSSPGSLSEPLTRTDALYFTLTTFTTVGFGDITARSQTGRVLTMLQMASGLLLVGVAARVLANAVRTGLRRQGREPLQ
ncbi:two pore domain potassium channel family protein [Streptomyces luteolifulvus]|jgi:hypothetical protein|uniref:Two pore domain potassium channel family protein n=1 Tax=Streptomyces luteolifulvus TaxID=2615112 RepID=A0A6H9V7D0_9ACTN|nr:potassium channel family protein [Streptomyces luteolifulvus]KAB1148196.1 two pore domain potassium channel family protein [Streptomyces luteolifulvus]